MCVGIDEVNTTSDGGGAAGLCNEESVCPSGSRAQGLAGCDPLTHSCVCQLGFQLDNGVCVGLSEITSLLLSLLLLLLFLRKLCSAEAIMSS